MNSETWQGINFQIAFLIFAVSVQISAKNLTLLHYILLYFFNFILVWIEFETKRSFDHKTFQFKVLMVDHKMNTLVNIHCI